MPVLTDGEWVLVRSWIGTTEEDAVFQERYDRLGTMDRAIIESLRAQLAAMVLDQPSSISTPDGLSVQFGENIRALRETLKAFINSGGTDTLPEEGVGGANVTRLERPSYR